MLFGADLAATGRRAESSGKVLNEALRAGPISRFRRQEISAGPSPPNGLRLQR
jgi:hypothetical protein